MVQVEEDLLIPDDDFDSLFQLRSTDSALMQTGMWVGCMPAH